MHMSKRQAIVISGVSYYVGYNAVLIRLVLIAVYSRNRREISELPIRPRSVLQIKYSSKGWAFQIQCSQPRLLVYMPALTLCYRPQKHVQHRHFVIGHAQKMGRYTIIFSGPECYSCAV